MTLSPVSPGWSIPTHGFSTVLLGYNSGDVINVEQVIIAELQQIGIKLHILDESIAAWARWKPARLLSGWPPSSSQAVKARTQVGTRTSWEVPTPRTANGTSRTTRHLQSTPQMPRAEREHGVSQTGMRARRSSITSISCWGAGTSRRATTGGATSLGTRVPTARRLAGAPWTRMTGLTPRPWLHSQPWPAPLPARRNATPSRDCQQRLRQPARRPH